MAAAEADALAARHHSLVQRRRRMRSALRVLEVSESGRAALETGAAGAEQAGERGARAEEAMKVLYIHKWVSVGGSGRERRVWIGVVVVRSVDVSSEAS